MDTNYAISDETRNELDTPQPRPTVAEALAAHPLAPAVLTQLGMVIGDGYEQDAIDSAIEAGHHGANAGWHGFTYYTDTRRFFADNRLAILDQLVQLSDDIGESVHAMVSRTVGEAIADLRDND